MSPAPVQAVSAASAADPLLTRPGTVHAGSPGGASFAQWLANGVAQVNQKLVSADDAAAAFALDDSVPVHQVTFALEQARLSFELMMQVRTRLLDSYQELSRMQI